MNMSTPMAAATQRSKTYRMATVAVMTAVLCVLAPVAVPIGPVPISLATLAIYFTLYLLGWKLGTLSCVVYLLLGTFGLPVFSGFSGGVGKLLGPTGGYLIGYIPMAVIGALAIERYTSRAAHFIGLALGTLVLYALGTAWLCYSAGMALVPALGVAVFPFIPGDTAKILLAMLLGPVIRERLARAGLL